MISEAHLMDNMEYMKTVPDKWFDLAVVDSPYGIGEDGSKNHTRCKLATSKNYKGNSGNDIEPPSKECFAEIMRISKNQIIWGANHFISRMPFDSSCWIVWDKDNGETDFADCELAWTSFDTAVRKFRWRWQGMLQQDMKNKQVRIHPNEKPIQLYSWLYHNYLPIGGKVFDPFLGSGSNRIAADKAGNIDFYATEIDADYFNAQEKRWREYKAQGVLEFPL